MRCGIRSRHTDFNFLTQRDFLPGMCPEPLRCGSRMTPTARLLQGVHRALSVRVLVGT